MKLIALEIPDDAADLAGWLDGHLVGLDLSALVAELETIGRLGERPATPPLSLETILGKEREVVLARGLASLSQDRLRQLLRHPRLLLDLQELIRSSGRPYWHRRAGSPGTTNGFFLAFRGLASKTLASSTLVSRVPWSPGPPWQS
jgi:hypothetical protein